MHGPGYSGSGGIGSSLDGTAPYSETYHVFAIEWEPNIIRPFLIIMNVAVGGQWPGYPDATTTFPQTMHVDYVRVYQAPDTAERFEADVVDDFDGWHKIIIPFEQFARSATQPANAPDDGLTLTETWGYGVQLPTGSNGSFYMDLVQVYDLTKIYLPLVMNNG